MKLPEESQAIIACCRERRPEQREGLLRYLKANCWLSLQRTSEDPIGSFIMYYPYPLFTTSPAINSRTHTQESFLNYSRGKFCTTSLPPSNQMKGKSLHSWEQEQKASQNSYKNRNFEDHFCVFFIQKKKQVDITFLKCWQNVEECTCYCWGPDSVKRTKVMKVIWANHESEIWKSMPGGPFRKAKTVSKNPKWWLKLDQDFIVIAGRKTKWNPIAISQEGPFLAKINQRRTPLSGDSTDVSKFQTLARYMSCSRVLALLCPSHEFAQNVLNWRSMRTQVFRGEAPFVPCVVRHEFPCAFHKHKKDTAKLFWDPSVLGMPSRWHSSSDERRNQKKGHPNCGTKIWYQMHLHL